MPRFTDTQEITYLEVHESISLTTKHGTTGVLTVEVFDGLDWVVADTFDAVSGCFEYFVKGLTLRFTPTLGMVYTVPLGR